MDYMIEYYKDKDTDPKVFLQRFRCTTEPIGGSTEHDDEGELVDWDAAIVALEICKQQFIDKACEWLKENIYNRVYECGDRLGYPTADFLKDFRKAMEVTL